MEDALERSGKGKRWLLRHLRQAGYPMRKNFLRGVDTGTRILYRPAGGTRRPECGKGNAFGRLRTEQPETAFRTTRGTRPRQPVRKAVTEPKTGR